MQVGVPWQRTSGVLKWELRWHRPIQNTPPAEYLVDLTQILNEAKVGDSVARAQLIEAAYQELRQLAVGKMADERQDHTLTSTALVHEVSMRMLNESQLPMENRSQFFAYASKAMRNLLIDHARTRGRQKRGGDRKKFSFDEAMIACNQQRDEFLQLNEVLEQFEEIEPRKAQVVEMRYFGGMSNQEIASALGVSLATVKRDWLVAQSWLLRELIHDDSPSGDAQQVAE